MKISDGEIQRIMQLSEFAIEGSLYGEDVPKLLAERLELRKLLTKLHGALKESLSWSPHHAEGCAAHDDGECTTDCGEGPGCPLDEECSCTIGRDKYLLAEAVKMGLVEDEG